MAGGLTLSLLAGACHRDADAGPCATRSSYEMVLATLNPGFTWVAAPDDPLAWQVEKRPFFCTEHIAAVSLEKTEFGPELMLTPTDEGRRIMHEVTAAHIGQYIIFHIEGRARFPTHIEAPVTGKVQRINMSDDLAADAEGIASRLRAELVRRPK